MTLETETVLDRRRLRRHVTVWRAAAVAGVTLAIGALAIKGEQLDGLGTHQIARISIEGMIQEKREQIKMLNKIRDAKNVDAVLVFINSPGGTTTGGEAIYEGLREIAYGEWESLRHEDVQEKWPEAYAYWTADTASRGAPGGETAFEVAARAAYYRFTHSPAQPGSPGKAIGRTRGS